MLPRSTLGLLAGCIFLAGCMVGPRYEPPKAAPVQSDYATPEIVSSSVSSPAWWSLFGDPTLDELMTKALASNLDVAIAVARVDQARALFSEEKLELFPHVRADGTYTRGNQQILGVAKTPVPIENARLGFDAAWEIDLFGRVRHAIRAARAGELASREDLEAMRVSVAAEVVRNFLVLRGAQQLEAVTEQNIAAARETLRLTQVRFDNGGADPVDVETTKVQLQSELEKLPDLRTQQLRASARLAVLCGQRAGELDTMLLVKALPVPVREGALPIGEISDLLKRRPDVRAAERRMAAETERTGVATADLFPRLSVTGFIGFLSGDVSSLVGSNGKAWSVSPAVSWPALDLGSAAARLRAQRARQTEVELEYQKTALGAIEELQNALVGYRNDRERLSILAEQITAATRADQLAGIRYREGSIDYIRRLTVLRSKLASEEAFVRAQTASNVDVVAIYKALGGVSGPSISSALP